MRKINIIYKLFAARKIFVPLSKFMVTLGLRGLGILNYENEKVSGEDFFLKQITKKFNNLNVLDIGANVGKYSKKIKYLSPDSIIYAFEPHPKNFKLLELEAKKSNFTAINLGCSDQPNNLKLYDYQELNIANSHASLYESVFTDIHHKKSKSIDIEVTTLDSYCCENNISKIHLLKIDTEGHEFKILAGAKDLIENDVIDCIHFEFNEMNIASRVFMKDFYNLLPQFNFYRLITDGLISLGEYKSISCEIFAYQNIVAINKKISTQFSNLIV